MDHDICCPRAGKRAPSSHSQSSDPAQFKSRQQMQSSSYSRPANQVSKVAPRANPQRHHRPTPSPLPRRNENSNSTHQPQHSNSTHRPPHQRHIPPLPSWIRKFTSESNRNSSVPAPRGSKWLPCPNPWGKIGHQDGDFVIISPFQSESASDMLSIFHQETNNGCMSVPKRFVSNPLEEGSPYHATHRSPARGGYSVLRLARDKMALRPWGFTVRLHEFGGACLVDSIEPLSPAEAAVSIISLFIYTLFVVLQSNIRFSFDKHHSMIFQVIATATHHLASTYMI